MISQAQKNLRGILAMNAAMCMFVLNDTLVKMTRVHWEAGQILVIRGAFALIIIFGWLLATGEIRHAKSMARPMVVARASIEAFIATAFITAIGSMALADITAILMLAPLLITALSMIFYKEKVGWRRWLAVTVGFIGMLCVVRPGGNVSGVALLLAMGSAIGVAWRDILTRQISSEIPGSIITLVSTFGTMFGGLILTASGMVTTGMHWRPISMDLLISMMAAALTVAIGNFAIILACRDVEFSVVSPFRYSVLLWAVLLGALVFGDIPNSLGLFGIVLIVGSGIYTIHRERVRQAEIHAQMVDSKQKKT
jgi:drug/metabolite transporter (DMT)-like permease